EGVGLCVQVRRSDGSTPLIVASVFGHADVVELLLQVRFHVHLSHQSPSVGSRVITDSSIGSRPIIDPSIGSRLISDLLQAGAKLKPRDEDGNALENARKQARSSDMDRIVRMLEKAFDER
ncbi:MAG: hypothetical protein SGPRY_005288, partial [Prymnesium sp.]